MRLRFIPFVVVAALLVSACPKSPLGGGRTGAIKSSDQYLALQRARTTPNHMSAQGKIRISWPAKSIRVRTGLRVKVSQPDCMRGEVLGMAGHPAVMLALCEENMQAYVRPMNSFLVGDDAAAIFEAVSDGLLEPQTFVELLVGRLPGFEGWTGEVVREDATGQLRLELVDGTGRAVTVWLTDGAFEPVRLVGYAPGFEGVAYAMGFEDYITVDRYRMPMSVTLEVPRIGLTMNLAYKDISTSKEGSGSDYVLAPPKGSKVQTFDELLSTIKETAKEVSDPTTNGSGTATEATTPAEPTPEPEPEIAPEPAPELVPDPIENPQKPTDTAPPPEP